MTDYTKLLIKEVEWQKIELEQNLKWLEEGTTSLKDFVDAILKVETTLFRCRIKITRENNLD